MVGLMDINTLSALRTLTKSPQKQKEKNESNTTVSTSLVLVDEANRFLLARGNPDVEKNLLLIRSRPSQNMLIFESLIKRTWEVIGIKLQVPELKFKMILYRNQLENRKIDIFFEAHVDGYDLSETAINNMAGWYALNELPDNLEEHVKFALDHWNSNITILEFNV